MGRSLPFALRISSRKELELQSVVRRAGRHERFSATSE
jgi:hypothetical protein